jgi:cell fate (sporulation/competence/biofilm development) regulator YmcA (YheA/YmcA/DUF963 family)
VKEQLLNKLVQAFDLVREVQDELNNFPEIKDMAQKNHEVDQHIMSFIYDIEDTNSEEFL